VKVSIPVLQQELRRRIEGEVRFDAGSRALYSTDASNYRLVPLGVVVPRHEGDVIAAAALARDNQMAIVPRGGGTSLAGQACNRALVFDFSKYLNSIRLIDTDRRIAVVEPGSPGDWVPSLAQSIRAYSESSSTLQLIGSSKGSIPCCLTSCMSLVRTSAAPSIWKLSRASSSPSRSMITAKNFRELVVIEASSCCPAGTRKHHADRASTNPA